MIFFCVIKRKQLGLTQSETAVMCNVETRFFLKLENGKETLQMNKVLHCLEMLGINLYAENREDDTEGYKLIFAASIHHR